MEDAAQSLLLLPSSKAASSQNFPVAESTAAPAKSCASTVLLYGLEHGALRITAVNAYLVVWCGVLRVQVGSMTVGGLMRVGACTLGRVGRGG